MKYFVILCLFFSSQSFAANLDLNGGESAVINASVNTKVTCGGTPGGSDCASKAAAFSSVLKKCLSNGSTEFCFKNTWPKWRNNNSNCQAEGNEICIDKCFQLASTESCMKILCE